MGIDYSSENPHAQLARLRAEGPHIERLTEAAIMWRTAQQRIREARDDLSARTDALLASWRDDAGQAFGARVGDSVRSLTAWHDRIEGSGVVGQINALQLTYPNCVAGVQAVCDRFQAALQAQQGDPATLERQYAGEAARYTNHVADRMDRVTVAMGTLADAGTAWTGAVSGGSAGAGGAPGGSGAGEQPAPGEGAPGAEQGAANQAQGQQGQQGGGQDPLQQGMSAAQQLAQQLAQQMGGTGVADPGTDPSRLDPPGSTGYPGADPNGLPGLAGLGGASVGGGGGFSPTTQPMTPGSSPVPTGSAPSLAGAPPTGGASPGAGMGGMGPMMAPFGGHGGLGAAGGGVRPGDAERTGRERRAARRVAVAGVPAALRGRSGQPTPGGAAVPARPREERAHDSGEFLDEELWQVAGQDHKRADSRGTLRSI